ncbi:hypothetical protein E2C01_080034 [Portunus trituberculatus]|uniref:Uncharacterized protein n=1 Tax=Portunus trituberculatus TaxID=210409 RepID=A0A5B7ISY4_PORTR|nr:hypothetical protein [Portunus trituberculatus]
MRRDPCYYLGATTITHTRSSLLTPRLNHLSHSSYSSSSSSRQAKPSRLNLFPLHSFSLSPPPPPLPPPPLPHHHNRHLDSFLQVIFFPPHLTASTARH